MTLQTQLSSPHMGVLPSLDLLTELAQTNGNWTMQSLFQSWPLGSSLTSVSDIWLLISDGFNTGFWVSRILEMLLVGRFTKKD